MYISSKPTFFLNQAIGNKSYGNISTFPFNHTRCHFFFSARYALAAGVQALGITSKQNLLMPSYNCWVEIDPIKYQDIQIKYYRIRSDLTVDLDDLKAIIDDKTKAVLITHYLGFPQPVDAISRICKERQIFLIEDCAHAFLSEFNGKPIGSFGDISVFSFRKTLPIPNGAGLIINNENITFEHQIAKPSSFSTYYVCAEFLKHRTTKQSTIAKMIFIKVFNEAIYLSFFFLRSLLRIFRKIFNRRGLYLVYPSGNQYRKEISHWGMSSLSKNIIMSSNFEKIKDIRRRNFRFFLNYFQNDKRVTLPFKELPDGVCPLFFPIIIEKRDYFYKALKKRGIAGHDWWGDFHPDVPWNNFPEAVFLKRNILGLPIHQDLSLKHLQAIEEEFEKAYQSMER
ncbi:aminotransferase class V-fold PLP-dependent enzyme [Desulfobacula sp.]|uniref:aminotransferase class V-fold PLP-dependent enzyme n=1 Tax=Desulfobacula sp. TaxID=2593537 RepID=UPI002714F0EE|nr:aminotransferase class V-fold PLP-dependent enzyme [Desulfobacula sp.]